MQRPHNHTVVPLTLALLIALALSGCSPQSPTRPSGEEAFLTSTNAVEPIELPTSEKLNVVASTNIIFDILQNVGGESIQLEALIPRGADPHAYEPSPGDLRKLAQADLVFINGVGLEEPLYPTLSEIAGDTLIISLSEGLPLLSFAEQASTGEETHSDDDHEHAGMDPHVWLDPINVRTWVANTAAVLSVADPARADRYRQNASIFSRALDELNASIQETIAEIPVENRKLVTDHRALGYFAARYNFDLISTVIPAYSTAAEPSARELADLVETIASESVQAIFVGSNVNTTLAERVAADTGIQVVPLYIGTLGPLNGPAGSYMEMMEYNVDAITTALTRK
jgi:ABC-type Zn uptake system ZnuABC Zn-binding protein ZnuA